MGLEALGRERSVKVTVKLGAPLSQVVGERSVIVSMPQAATIADVLQELRARYPEFEAGLRGKGLRNPANDVLYSLFLNAHPVPLSQAGSTRLRDGDHLYFFLPVAGGD